MRRTQGFRPALAQIAEIGVAVVNPGTYRVLQLTAADDENVNRQADGEIGLQGRVHRNETDLQRVPDTDFMRNRAVENRLAVFRLTDLQERRVRRRLDRIAFGIKMEQPQCLIADLSAQKHVDVE